MLCNGTVGMPEYQRPAITSQPELLLKSVGAVSALEYTEFQRDIVQKIFWGGGFVCLFFCFVY